MERPFLFDVKDSSVIKNFYYLKSELVEFCKKNNLKTTGSKQEIIDRIVKFLDYEQNQDKEFNKLTNVALIKSSNKKSSNQIITFNTLNENIRWQIFSIYKIPVTTDYLYTDFSNDDEFIEFVNQMKSRSIYDFNVDISKDDNILTLSTCSNGHDQRLVIHAKKIKES